MKARRPKSMVLLQFFIHGSQLLRLRDEALGTSQNPSTLLRLIRSTNTHPSSQPDLALCIDCLERDAGLFSHNCAPSSSKLADLEFSLGNQCGPTYAPPTAFVLHHPELACRVLAADTGMTLSAIAYSVPDQLTTTCRREYGHSREIVIALRSRPIQKGTQVLSCSRPLTYRPPQASYDLNAR